MNQYKETIISVRSQKAYDNLMNQLESENYCWVTSRPIKSIDMWYKFGRNTTITIYQWNKTIVYGNLENEFNQKLVQVFKPKDKLEFN